MSYQEVSEDHDLEYQEYVDFLHSIEEGDEDRILVRGLTEHDAKLNQEDEQE